MKRHPGKPVPLDDLDVGRGFDEESLALGVVGDPHIPPGELFGDRSARAHQLAGRIRPGRARREPQAERGRLRRVAPVDRGGEAKLSGGRVVPIGGATIGAAMTGLERENARTGMQLAPLAPGHHARPQENQALPERRARHRLGPNLRPQALAIAIIKEEIGTVEETRHTKDPLAPADPAIEDHRRSAERTVGDQDRSPPERVVDELVPLENRDRIGRRFAADDNADDPILGVPGSFAGRDRRGIHEGRNSVSRRSAGENLDGWNRSGLQ